MKVGDKVRCTYSVDSDFTVGNLYEIESFDKDGDPVLIDNDGYIGFIGVVMNGTRWRFEEVE